MIPDSKKIPIIEQIGQGTIISILLRVGLYSYDLADYALNDGADEELQMMAVCSVMFRQFQ